MNNSTKTTTKHTRFFECQHEKCKKLKIRDLIRAFEHLERHAMKKELVEVEVKIETDEE